jgi:hypothetical protein
VPFWSISYLSPDGVFDLEVGAGAFAEYQEA